MSQLAHDQLQASLQGITLQQYRLRQLQIAIADRKIKAYDYMRSLERLSRKDLDSAGYTGYTNCEAVQMALLSAVREIEAMTRKYEKENPDED